MTQGAIAETLKHAIGFCALKRGDAIDVAISLKLTSSTAFASISLPSPHSMVSGRSVASLHINGLLVAHAASSCNPPLSAIIPKELETKRATLLVDALTLERRAKR